MIAAFLSAVGFYLACGFLFAAAFVTRGVGSLDTTAKGASLGFRFLILPGSVALWPYLAVRWAHARKSP